MLDLLDTVIDLIQKLCI